MGGGRAGGTWARALRTRRISSLVTRETRSISLSTSLNQSTCAPRRRRHSSPGRRARDSKKTSAGRLSLPLSLSSGRLPEAPGRVSGYLGAPEGQRRTSLKGFPSRTISGDAPYACAAAAGRSERPGKSPADETSLEAARAESSGQSYNPASSWVPW